MLPPIALQFWNLTETREPERLQTNLHPNISHPLTGTTVK